VTEAEVDLLAAVDAAFEVTAAGLARWPNPHPLGVTPAEDEYSRLTDPGRWAILGARVEAWIAALRPFSVPERDVEVTWLDPPGGHGHVPTLVGADRLVPHVVGGLPLTFGRSELGGMPVGVVLGVGDPAWCPEFFPDCGCDACDSGSEHELDHLDAHVYGIVTGRYRRLTRGAQLIEVLDGDRGWSGAGWGRRSSGEVDRILAASDPTQLGWTEVTGPSWIVR
jgi:hypothetical protein